MRRLLLGLVALVAVACGGPEREYEKGLSKALGFVDFGAEQDVTFCSIQSDGSKYQGTIHFATPSAAATVKADLLRAGGATAPKHGRDVAVTLQEATYTVRDESPTSVEVTFPWRTEPASCRREPGP